jgi:hypothetical protein
VKKCGPVRGNRNRTYLKKGVRFVIGSASHCAQQVHVTASAMGAPTVSGLRPAQALKEPGRRPRGRVGGGVTRSGAGVLGTGAGVMRPGPVPGAYLRLGPFLCPDSGPASSCSRCQLNLKWSHMKDRELSIDNQIPANELYCHDFTAELQQ